MQQRDLSFAGWACNTTNPGALVDVAAAAAAEVRMIADTGMHTIADTGTHTIVDTETHTIVDTEIHTIADTGTQAALGAQRRRPDRRHCT